METEKNKKIKRNSVACLILIALMLSSCIAIQSVVADPVGYQDISVQEANNLISSDPHVFILDVRNQSEYNLGHLYGASIVPLDQIEQWNWNSTDIDDQPFIDILQAHINNTILVYCKGGSRSAPACQILADHGFTKVYNMEGGITSWMQAQYPIYTKYHHVNIGVVDNQPVIEINPWLLYQLTCTTCQNQTCGTTGAPMLTNTSTTILEQNENQTIVLITGDLNGTTVEYTLDTTLVSRLSSVDDGVNRTTTLMSMQMIGTDWSEQLYALKYKAQNDNYNVTLVTSLVPSGPETYNGSVTILSYDPVAGTPIKTKEIVDFNASMPLSQKINLMGDASEMVGEEYENSDDALLQQLTPGYVAMKDEMTNLSDIINNNLSDYNRLIVGDSRNVIGVGIALSDPEALSNGGFESGTSYWTIGGSGNHYVSSSQYYSGTHSLLLGYESATLVANDRDWAYQSTYLPSNAYNIQLSFKYKIVTEDSSAYDRLEVYVALSGGNPQLLFSSGGSTRGGWETYGWSSWSTSLQDYADSSFYIYADVYNGGDTSYRTYAFLDDVSITYEEVNNCNFNDLVNCALSDPQALAYCTYFAWACAYVPIPENPACWLLAGCVAVYAIGCYLEYCW